ncbi:MAG TPA: hypothetical protein VF603_01610 [Allosphingosinicella sp.]
MTHRIILRPAAVEDLAAIYDWIAEHANDDTATAYRDRVSRGLCPLGGLSKSRFGPR